MEASEERQMVNGSQKRTKVWGVELETQWWALGRVYWYPGWKVTLFLKMCWVVRNPCEKVRGLDKGNLVDDSPQYACSKVVGKSKVFMVNMLPLNPLRGWRVVTDGDDNFLPCILKVCPSPKAHEQPGMSTRVGSMVGVVRYWYLSKNWAYAWRKRERLLLVHPQGPHQGNPAATKRRHSKNRRNCQFRNGCWRYGTKCFRTVLKQHHNMVGTKLPLGVEWSNGLKSKLATF